MIGIDDHNRPQPEAHGSDQSRHPGLAERPKEEVGKGPGQDQSQEDKEVVTDREKEIFDYLVG